MDAKMLGGLRDFRDSLLSGLLWVSSLVLVAVLIWPDKVSGNTLFSSGFQRVISFVGSTGTLVAMTGLSIVVGEIWTGVFSNTTFRLSIRSVRKAHADIFNREIGDRMPRFWPVSSRALIRLRKHAGSKISINAALPLDTDLQRACLETLQEMLYSSPRLMAANKELYLEYDRLKSNSRFYDATSLPWGAFVVCLSLNIEISVIGRVILCVLGLISSLAFFRFARKHFRDAHSLLAHSLADDLFTSTTLDSWV